MESSWHTCLKSIEINGLATVSKSSKKCQEKAKEFKMPLLSKELRSTCGGRNQDDKRWFLRPLACWLGVVLALNTPTPCHTIHLK